LLASRHIVRKVAISGLLVEHKSIGTVLKRNSLSVSICRPEKAAKKNLWMSHTAETIPKYFRARSGSKLTVIGAIEITGI
jgi:hypothetical protein